LPGIKFLISTVFVLKFGVYVLPTTDAAAEVVAEEVVAEEVVALVVKEREVVVVPVVKETLPSTVLVRRTEFNVNSNALGSGE